jgi:hypothetical protein
LRRALLKLAPDEISLVNAIGEMRKSSRNKGLFTEPDRFCSFLAVLVAMEWQRRMVFCTDS